MRRIENMPGRLNYRYLRSITRMVDEYSAISGYPHTFDVRAAGCRPC